MFVLVLVLLLTANIGHALQCITNCSVGEFRFEEPFRIPNGQCQELNSASDCTVRVDLKYHDQVYTMEFGRNRSSADFIYISSLPYLSYTTNHYCSEGTDCIFSQLQKKIDHLVHHPYNAQQIYAQLAPLIENPSEGHALKCYNIKNEIVECSHNQICGLDYDPQAKQVRSRGCQSSYGARVFIYDADDYSAFHIECSRNLCNDDATLTQIKTILANHGLTDSDGRRVVAGINKTVCSFSLLILALISVIILCF